METMYAIHVIPESFLEPNPVGWVRGESRYAAMRDVARILKLGLDITMWWS